MQYAVCVMWSNEYEDNAMRHLLVKLLLVVHAVFCLVACGHRQASGSFESRNIPVEVVPPPIPPLIDDVRERVGWLTAHYWDNMDFSDRSLSLDTAFMEQSFASYISVLAMADSSALYRAVGILLDKAAPFADSSDFLFDIADRYLFDPESPVYSEELFLPFLDYAIAGGRDSIGILSEKREIALKNRPGSKVRDFTFATPEGATGHLIHRDSDADILLVFHEPGCGRCKAVEERLARDAAIAGQAAEGRLRVLFIYQGDDVGAWRKAIADFPDFWERGRDADGVIDRDDIFIVRATPTDYLLSPDGTVLHKDIRF